MKKAFFLIFVLVLTNHLFAQTKPVALKFDEFDDDNENYYPYEGTDITGRINRFVAQIKKESGKRVFMIYYRARVLDKRNENKSNNWAWRTKMAIWGETKLQGDDKIILIDGGYRARNTLEYWIAPEGADTPVPTPTFDKSESILCPNISIHGNGFEYDNSKIVTFSAFVYGPEPENEDSYKWKTSAGKIVKGQNTNEIEVDLSGTDVKTVSATLELDGLPAECGSVSFTKLEIGKKAYIFDSAVRYNYSDLAARLQGFMIFLDNDPTMKGHIIVYANRTQGARDMERAIASVQRVFAFLKLDLDRVTIVRGGYREYDTVDSWVLPAGADAPVPTPTVDAKFIQMPAKKKAVRKKQR